MRDLLFVGFNSYVVALSARSGEIVWEWKSSAGTRYVTVLADGDRLFVSVEGYTYCLDAETGEERWYNRLSGFGVGVASLATSRGAASALSASASQTARRSD
jgi:outer membrane protein assembly factor BamB